MDFSHIEWLDKGDFDKLYAETLARWLTPERVAEQLNLSVDQVIAACLSGELDSQWNEIKHGSRQYFIFLKEVDSYREKGPRKRMNFVEAMSIVRDWRQVRRALWNREYIGFNPSFDPNQDHHETVCLWWYYDDPDPGLWEGDPYSEGEDWYPTVEDKAATDWVEHEIVNRR